MAYNSQEGYVFHTFGSTRFLQHVVASVTTLRRWDTKRPIALYAPANHIEVLRSAGLSSLFDVIGDLPPHNQSVVGFKHNLHRFMPFDRNLYVDCDVVWCRDPGPLWKQFSAFPFTATGMEKADFFFGGPKSVGVVFDFIRDRRRRTMRHFGLTYLPRVQAGVIFAQDAEVTRGVCESATRFLDRRSETHFRSRLKEGRTEETCEWGLAMAMSSMSLSVVPWLQGKNSAQLDFVDSLTEYDDGFHDVKCKYYTDRFVYALRGLPNRLMRDVLISVFSRLPGRGDYLQVTPFILHFGWLRFKDVFERFAERVWQESVRSESVEYASDPVVEVLTEAVPQ
jgi:hypothetical protein